MPKKYKLGQKHPTENLYRVIALRDFANVKTGDVGGWVESEANLSQQKDCWVYDEARVFEKAYVYGNAKVYQQAEVFGEAWIYDNAKVFGNASVFGTSQVLLNTKVYGEAWVYENAKVSGLAQAYDHAEIYGSAVVSGEVRVYGYAKVSGNAQLTYRMDLNGTTFITGTDPWQLSRRSRLSNNSPVQKQEQEEAPSLSGVCTHPGCSNKAWVRPDGTTKFCGKHEAQEYCYKNWSHQFDLV